MRDLKNNAKYCWNCEVELKKVKIDYSKEKVTFCPRCGCKYPEKPKIEAKLSIYQEEYLKDRNKESFNKMFVLLDKLIFNILCSKLKKSAKKLDVEEIEDMKQWCLEKILQYYQKPDFKISGSFTGYLSKVVLYPLYNNKDFEKEKNEVSLFSPIGISSEGEELTLMDRLSEQSYFDGLTETENFLFGRIQRKQVLEEFMDFFEMVLKIFYQKQKKFAFSQTLKMALLIKHFINRKNAKFFSEWWSCSDVDLKNNFLKTIDIMKQNLYMSAMEE